MESHETHVWKVIKSEDIENYNKEGNLSYIHSKKFYFLKDIKWFLGNGEILISGYLINATPESGNSEDGFTGTGFQMEKKVWDLFDRKTMEFLEDSNVFSNMSDINHTPLLRSCQSGNLELIRVFIENGFEISGTKLYIEAARYGKKEILGYLFSAKSVNEYAIWVSLEEAICSGQLETVRYLVNTYKLLVDLNDERFVALSGRLKDTEVLEFLLKNEFKFSDRILKETLRFDSIKVLEFILKKGYRLHPLLTMDIANIKSNKQWEILKLLTEYNLVNPRDKVLSKDILKNREMARYFLNNGFEISRMGKEDIKLMEEE